MYCTNCGNKLADNSNKCGECGHEVLLPGKAEFSSERKGANNKKRFLPVAIGIGVVIIAVLIILKPAKPEQVGVRFTKAFEQEKWAQVYKYFNLDEVEDEDLVTLLDKDYFIDSLCRCSMAGNGVETVDFDPQEDLNEFQNKLLTVLGSAEDKNQYNSDRYWEGNFTIYWNNGGSQSFILPLINTGTRRPNWKVSMAPFVETRTIDTLAGVQVEVEGYSLASQDQMRKGCYQYKAFPRSRNMVQLSGDSIEPVEFLMAESSAKVTDLEPSAQTVEQIKNATLRYLKTNSPIKKIGSKTKVYTFQDAQFDEASFAFLDSINHAEIKVIEVWEKSIQDSNGSAQDKDVLKYELTYEIARTEDEWQVVNRWDGWWSCPLD